MNEIKLVLVSVQVKTEIRRLKVSLDDIMGNRFDIENLDAEKTDYELFIEKRLEEFDY